MRSFNDEKKAKLEAFLTDSVLLTITPGKKYEVISRKAAKKRLKLLAYEKRFMDLNEISDQLATPIEFSDDKIKKSLRVSFHVYAELVKLALLENTTIGSQLVKVVTRSLQPVISELLARDDISVDKKDFLRESMKDWKTTKRSHARREFRPTYYYSPLDDKFSDIYLRALLNIHLRNIENHYHNKISTKGIKYIVDKTRDLLSSERKEDFFDYFYLYLILVNKHLIFQIKGLYVAGVDPEDSEVKEHFTKSDISFLAKEGDEDLDHIYSLFQSTIFEQPLVFDGDDLIIQDVKFNVELFLSSQVVDGTAEFNDEENVSLILSKLWPEEDRKNLENGLLEAIKDENYERVSKLSEELSYHQSVNTSLRWSLRILESLLSQTQVVSFTGPELLIRLWEAYCYRDQDLNEGRALLDFLNDKGE